MVTGVTNCYWVTPVFNNKKISTTTTTRDRTMYLKIVEDLKDLEWVGEDSLTLGIEERVRIIPLVGEYEFLKLNPEHPPKIYLGDSSFPNDCIGAVICNNKNTYITSREKAYIVDSSGKTVGMIISEVKRKPNPHVDKLVGLIFANLPKEYYERLTKECGASGKEIDQVVKEAIKKYVEEKHPHR